MRIVLVKKGPKEGYDTEEYDGNHLLHHLLEAEIKVVRSEHQQKIFEETMEELKNTGHRPFLLRGSTPLGVAGYVNAMLELVSQTVECGIDIDYLIHASDSGVTQAGLLIGAKAFNPNIKVLGVATSRSCDEMYNKIAPLMDESIDFMKTDLKIDQDEMIV